MIVMNSVATYIRTLPIASGIRVTQGFMSDVDANCITVFATGGFEGNFKLGLDIPTLQIRVRHTSPATAVLVAQGLYDALHGMGKGVIANVLSMRGLQSGPTNIDQDEAGRQEYTLNFALKIQNITTFRE
jgi:hypothetical protein